MLRQIIFLKRKYNDIEILLKTNGFDFYIKWLDKMININNNNNNNKITIDDLIDHLDSIYNKSYKDEGPLLKTIEKFYYGENEEDKNWHLKGTEYVCDE